MKIITNWDDLKAHNRRLAIAVKVVLLITYGSLAAFAAWSALSFLLGLWDPFSPGALPADCVMLFSALVSAWLTTICFRLFIRTVKQKL
jgi:hypothetical protein